MGNKAEHDTQLLETSRRRRAVLQLRESGATWPRIAETLEKRFGKERLPSGWDARYAYKDFKRELKKIRRDTADSLENVRDMELRRIDRMLAGIWRRAIGGDGVSWKQQKEAIDRVVKLQKRRAQLAGLDAPKKLQFMDVDLTELTDEQLEKVAQGMPWQQVLEEDEE